MDFIGLIIGLATGTNGKFQRRGRAAPFLAGTLGALTPCGIYVTFAERAGDAGAISSAIYLVCLPGILLGTALGGVLGLYTKKTWPESHVFLVASVWGLLGGLVPAILWALFT